MVIVTHFQKSHPPRPIETKILLPSMPDPVNVLINNSDTYNAVGLLDLIKRGSIAEAIDLVRAEFPQIMTESSAASKKCAFSNIQMFYMLLAQQFIELIREGNTQGAFSFAQSELVPFATAHPECQQLQEQVLGLLAYKDPHVSPMRQLLDKSRYALLAEKVNEAILCTGDSALENAMRQIMAVDKLVEEVGGFHEEADLKKWATLQTLLSGTSLASKINSLPPVLPKLKSIKND